MIHVEPAKVPGFDAIFKANEDQHELGLAFRRFKSQDAQQAKYNHNQCDDDIDHSHSTSPFVQLARQLRLVLGFSTTPA